MEMISRAACVSARSCCAARPAAPPRSSPDPRPVRYPSARLWTTPSLGAVPAGCAQHSRAPSARGAPPSLRAGLGSTLQTLRAGQDDMTRALWSRRPTPRPPAPHARRMRYRRGGGLSTTDVKVWETVDRENRADPATRMHQGAQKIRPLSVRDETFSFTCSGQLCGPHRTPEASVPRHHSRPGRVGIGPRAGTVHPGNNSLQHPRHHVAHTRLLLPVC